MSYSRWGQSRWYTYWCVHPDDDNMNHEDERFEVGQVRQFTFGELKRMTRDEFEAVIAAADPQSTARQRHELTRYAEHFMKDALSDYELDPEPPWASD